MGERVEGRHARLHEAGAGFKEKDGRPFTLLADPDHALAEAVLRGVDPATHADDVLAALDAGG